MEEHYKNNYGDVSYVCVSVNYCFITSRRLCPYLCPLSKVQLGNHWSVSFSRTL